MTTPGIIALLAWLFFAGAAFYAIQMWRADRELQKFRAPGRDASSYSLVPVRWKYELYTDAGRSLVIAAKRSFFVMLLLALLGMLFLAVAQRLTLGAAS